MGYICAFCGGSNVYYEALVACNDTSYVTVYHDTRCLDCGTRTDVVGTAEGVHPDVASS